MHCHLGNFFPCFFYVSWVILSLLLKMRGKKNPQPNQTKQSKKQGTETGKPSSTKEQQELQPEPQALIAKGRSWVGKEEVNFTNKEHI